MTDAELDALEKRVSGPIKSPWRKEMYYEAKILELIAMVRSLQNERDYLAEHRPVRYCPTLQKWETCDLPNFDGPYLPLKCFQCWKESAREAVCQTN